MIDEDTSAKPTTSRNDVSPRPVPRRRSTRPSSEDLSRSIPWTTWTANPTSGTLTDSFLPGSQLPHAARRSGASSPHLSVDSERSPRFHSPAATPNRRAGDETSSLPYSTPVAYAPASTLSAALVTTANGPAVTVPISTLPFSRPYVPHPVFSYGPATMPLSSSHLQPHAFNSPPVTASTYPPYAFPGPPPSSYPTIPQPVRYDWQYPPHPYDPNLAALRGVVGTMKRHVDLQSANIDPFNGDPRDYMRFRTEF